VNKRYLVKCSTVGGRNRHMVIYAPSAPKARDRALDAERQHLGVGQSRIRSVLDVTLDAQNDLRS
jgi:hypothetical protein